MLALTRSDWLGLQVAAGYEALHRQAGDLTNQAAGMCMEVGGEGGGARRETQTLSHAEPAQVAKQDQGWRF